MRALIVVAPVVFTAAWFLALPAGASGDVGRVAVSDTTPDIGSTIDVSSSGWRAGDAVVISLSPTDRVLARAAADANGAVHARIRIPADSYVDTAVLELTGTATSGVPQQVVTGLEVRRTGPTPAPARPWTAALLLAAVAAVLILASTSLLNPRHRSRLAT